MQDLLSKPSVVALIPPKFSISSCGSLKRVSMHLMLRTLQTWTTSLIHNRQAIILLRLKSPTLKFLPLNPLSHSLGYLVCDSEKTKLSASNFTSTATSTSKPSSRSQKIHPFFALKQLNSARLYGFHYLCAADDPLGCHRILLIGCICWSGSLWSRSSAVEIVFVQVPSEYRIVDSMSP